ncbi:hypothetical protein BaRGS_00016396 [Batillaria attramentaria]|uniref:Uncharacterized protein n=1 Tax=Batillaria attramentaria TaxID=370345 RepID=A0ABD0KYL2_9CAEN
MTTQTRSAPPPPPSGNQTRIPARALQTACGRHHGRPCPLGSGRSSEGHPLLIGGYLPRLLHAQLADPSSARAEERLYSTARPVRQEEARHRPGGGPSPLHV